MSPVLPISCHLARKHSLWGDSGVAQALVTPSSEEHRGEKGTREAAESILGPRVWSDTRSVLSSGRKCNRASVWGWEEAGLIM